LLYQVAESIFKIAENHFLKIMGFYLHHQINARI